MSKKNNHYISKCRGQTHKGNAKQLINRYAELAKSEEDLANRQMYLNYQEHYQKVLRGT